jgi:hypothetical protein
MKITLAALAFSLPALLIVLTPHAYADAAQAQGRFVTMTGSALGESHYATCAPLTVLLGNAFPREQVALVDIELRSASSTIVDQEFSDNLLIPSTKKSGQPIALTNHCNMNLVGGTYTYSVGIFTPGWGSLLHWYSNVASFTAQPFQASSAIQLVRIERPKTNLPNSARASITPTLINTGATQTGLTVTVSLWRGGNFIDRVVYTNQTLTQNTEASFPFQTIPLMAGSYTIHVDVTDSSGATLASFPNLGGIVVD